MKLMIANAFSLNMLISTSAVNAHAISKESARKAVDSHEWESIVGHADTARVFSSEIGIEIPFNRVTGEFTHGAKLLVGQYKGPRLPEGATSLPQGAAIQWWIVEIKALDETGLNTLLDPASCPYCGFRECGALRGETVCC